MAVQMAERTISDRERAIVHRIEKIWSEFATYRNVLAGQWRKPRR